jgi:SAM-dependent MidA family methyltransferase
MDLALYGDGGFYSTGGHAGRRGDFITSPEVGPLFGALIARWLDSAWVSLGRPDPFTFVEAGAGPGTLARSIRLAEPDCSQSLRYVAVEVSATQRERHPDWVQSVATLPTEPFIGVVFANELLDNLPFRLFVMDGGWREAYVVAQANGTFGEILRPADDLAALDLPLTAPHGARVPVQQAAAAWVDSALTLCGRLLLVDYGATTTAELAGRPWREWLRTYAGHERGQHYLRDPGSQDITCDVVIEQLQRQVAAPIVGINQAEFLRALGIVELVSEGQRIWIEHAAAPTLQAMRMRSRVSESEALLDPQGLGSFKVLEWVRH